jgi:hypothetical protein
MKTSKTVITKRPSNSSSANAKSGKSWAQQPQPVTTKTKPKKPKATVYGSKSGSAQSATKKLNPSSKQTMRRPGLVTSKATGG